MLGMAKEVLVMDMPESCSMCKFLYEFQGIKKCQLMNVLNNGASRLSQSTFSKKRHEKCPLFGFDEAQGSDWSGEKKVIMAHAIEIVEKNGKEKKHV